jgi:hypothetical protein
MRVSVSCLVFGLLTAMLANAGDYQPNPNMRYELTGTTGSLPEETPSEQKWVDSLVRNLKQSGARPDVVYKFAKSRAQLRVNGVPSATAVYVLRGRPELFLVMDPSGRYPGFLVDFKRNTVETAAWGEQLHIPPSRGFCVAVFDRPDWLGGIPVTGGPDNPKFGDRVASWQ